MNIILIAPPAAGKGTQAAKISKTYKVPHISTGDLLRNTSNEEIQKLLKEGSLVDDKIITKLLKRRLENEDCTNGYVLDGYPRNINQAKEYEQILKELNKALGIVIILDLDKEIAKQRIIGRVICQNCGNVYNELLKDTMPKEKGLCDNCHKSLIKRTDDNEETFNNRYETYEKETMPLIEYYENKGIAYHVNSGINMITTFNQIKDIIGEVYDKH